MSEHAAPRVVGPVTAAAALGAAVATIGIWAFEAATTIDMPTYVEGAVSVLAVTLAGWAVPTQKGT